MSGASSPGRIEVQHGASVPAAPAVSVIIPAYAPRWLADALESVRRQTLRNYELIVVDDGSPEPIVHGRSDDLVLVRQPNGGPGGARNRGVALARAPWVAFLDSDDVWLPRKLELQLDFHLRHPTALLSSTETQALHPLDPEHDMPQSRIERYGETGEIVPFEQIIYENPISCSASMVARAAYLDAGGMDEASRFAEDYRLWLRLAVRGPVGYIREPLVARRVHAASLSAQAHDNGSWLAREAAVYRDFLAEHPALACTPAVRRALGRLAYQAGYEHLRARRWAEARAALWQSLAHRPRSFAALKSLARAYLHLGSRSTSFAKPKPPARGEQETRG